MHWMFRLEVYGEDQIPESGGFLLLSNHVSYLDPMLVGCQMRRQMHSLAKSELFAIPFLGTLFRALNGHPIRRSGLDRAALRECVDLLEKGEILLVFPEGTRTHDGKLHPAKAGSAIMAQQAGVQCIAAYIEGAFAAWPRHRLLPRPAKIRVHFGAPFDLPEKTPEMSAKEYHALCAQVVTDQIAALRPPAAPALAPCQT